jgi:MFS family permease
MVGPALGGVIVAADGTRTALLVNAGLFATMVLTLATASGLPAAASEPTPTSGRLRAALHHAAQQPAIRRLISLQAVAMAFFTISIPVEVVYAQHTLHAGARGYGALLSAWGAGAIAGSAIYVRARGWPSWVLITMGAAGVGAGLVVMSVAPSLGVGLAGAAVGGVGNGIEVVSVRTALQEMAGELWMARMMSLNESLTEAVPGIGIMVGGTLTALADARAALAVAGIGSLIITAICAVVLRGLPEPEAPAAAADLTPAAPSDDLEARFAKR